MRGSLGPDGDDAIAGSRFRKQQLERANLVPADRVRREIIPLDPERFPEITGVDDWRRKSAQSDPR